MMNQHLSLNEPEAFDVLEPLLAEKSFDALTPGERAEVLDWVSEQEYQAMRGVLLKAQHCLPSERTGLQARPGSYQQLQARLKQHAKAKQTPVKDMGTWRKFLLQPIPAYKAAAAVFLVSLGVHVSHVQLTPHTPSELAYPIMADTSQMFQERGFSSPEEDTVITTLVRELQR